MVKIIKDQSPSQTVNRMTNIVNKDNMQDFTNAAKSGDASIVILKRPIFNTNLTTDLMAARHRALKSNWDKYAINGRATSATSFQADARVENGQFMFHGINGSSQKAFQKIVPEIEDLSKLFAYITGHRDICLVTIANFKSACPNKTSVPILISSWQMAGNESKLTSIIEPADIAYIKPGEKIITPDGNQESMYSVIAIPAIPMPQRN